MSVVLCEKCEELFDSDFQEIFEFGDYYELCENCFIELEEEYEKEQKETQG
jgi:hypothetical protein